MSTHSSVSVPGKCLCSQLLCVGGSFPVSSFLLSFRVSNAHQSTWWSRVYSETKALSFVAFGTVKALALVVAAVTLIAVCGAVLRPFTLGFHRFWRGADCYSGHDSRGPWATWFWFR